MRILTCKAVVRSDPAPDQTRPINSPFPTKKMIGRAWTPIKDSSIPAVASSGSPSSTKASPVSDEAKELKPPAKIPN